MLSADEVEQLDKLLDQVNAHLRDTELPPPPPASRDWSSVIAEHVDGE